MAKDDDNLDPELDEEFLEEEEAIEEADPDELLDDDELEDEEDLGVEDLDTVLAGEDPEAEIVPLVAKKKVKKAKKDVAEDEEEDDDDELIGEDDIEEDLGVILAARVKGRSEDDEEDPEEEERRHLPIQTFRRHLEDQQEGDDLVPAHAAMVRDAEVAAGHAARPDADGEEHADQGQHLPRRVIGSDQPVDRKADERARRAGGEARQPRAEPERDEMRRMAEDELESGPQDHHGSEQGNPYGSPVPPSAK